MQYQHTLTKFPLSSVSFLYHRVGNKLCRYSETLRLLLNYITFGLTWLSKTKWNKASFPFQGCNTLFLIWFEPRTFRRQITHCILGHPTPTLCSYSWLSVSYKMAQSSQFQNLEIEVRRAKSTAQQLQLLASNEQG